MSLPIRRIMIYKHGVGYYERRGNFNGESLRLSFPRAAMDDVLKSLVALDLGAGQVLSIDYETPEDRAALLAKGSIHLSDNHSLLDLLRDLRGRRVRCITSEKVATKTRPGFGLSGGSKADETPEEETDGQLNGLVVGVDFEEQESLQRAALAIYLPEKRQVHALPLTSLRRVELLDETAGADLDYFLRAAQSEEERRSATLHLSPGDHDLLVGYIAPAPSWRVSYRMLFEEQPAEASSTEAVAPAASSLLLQGWGLFDNQLEEDLEGVGLTLVAGMPVSFRYRLYEPKTPERPLVEDEERTVEAPLFFEGAPPPPAAAPAPMARGMALGAAMAMDAAEAPAEKSFSLASMEEALQVDTGGEERGALFAYQVHHPVSVARGQSAMVPIMSIRLAARRELLYNGHKLPSHPVASLRLENASGLTLERGPVTVLENGDYAGEAVVPFTRAGAELIVPYAVELGLKVEEQTRSERIVAALHVQHEYLVIDEYEIQQRSYHLTSTLERPAEVLIEHHPLHGYELYETNPPLEEGAAFMRWSVSCAPQTRTVFTVAERRLVSRREQVRGLSGVQLQRYLADKLLDRAAFESLQEVLRLYREIDQQQRAISRLDKEREAIFRQQKQIQGNLGPLAREGEEGELRRRYVAELNTLEDQLKNLAGEEERLRRLIAELEGQISNEMKNLELRMKKN